MIETPTTLPSNVVPHGEGLWLHYVDNDAEYSYDGPSWSVGGWVILDAEGYCQDCGRSPYDNEGPYCRGGCAEVTDDQARHYMDMTGHTDAGLPSQRWY